MTGTDAKPIRVALISGICVRHDAISASVADDAHALGREYGFETRLFTYANEYDDLDAVTVSSVNHICFDPFFIDSDVIIYHFGIYFELFNVIHLGNGKARQAVRFHNLTPRHLLPPGEWPTFEKSRTQLYNMTVADAVWPVSELNRQDIRALGIVPEERLETIPLCVGEGRRKGSLVNKSRDRVEILFVGRIVKAKGLMDLVEVAAELDRRALPFHLRIVGEYRFADPAFIRALRLTLRQQALDHCVTLVGAVSDMELRQEYARAHVFVLPSYHEGFCKPVVEAMHYGCVPVTYDAFNLRYVARGLSRTVPTGNIAALAQAVFDVATATRLCAEQPKNTMLPVDRRPMPIAEYEDEVDRVAAEYGAATTGEMLRAAVLRLIGQPSQPAG